jgi:hypothetical protein
MLGNYFYNKCIHKTVVAFGSLFNNINIKHLDEDGQTLSTLKVPLAYGPIQKFLSRVEQSKDGNRRVATTLPRMSFEMISIDYNPQRKASTIQTFKATSIEDGKEVKNIYNPVPYDIGFELNIVSKTQDDVLQIIEQIVPFFQPSFNVTVNLVSEISELKDIPIILNRINFRDSYEEDFKQRRLLFYTLTFTAKTYIFSQIPEDSSGLIKKVQVDYAADSILSAKRVMRYTSTPKALEDYNDDGVINSLDDPLIEYGDDFGFNQNLEEFGDFKTYSSTQGTDVDI